MKKKLIALFIMIVMVLASVVGLVACDPQEEENPNKPSGSKTAITVWVSELKGVKDKTEEQISSFLDANPAYKDKYNVTVDIHGEGEAATDMITDVATGADIYCFAQDQLGRLVEANALSKLGVKAKETVTNDNDAAGIAAVTLDGEMYAYPLTSDNGYFLYYDNTVFTAEDVKDLGTMVAKAKAASKKISFELGGSAWYTASFFFGAGCTSTWTYNNTTKVWKAADNFNSDKGLIAMAGMNILTGDAEVWANSSSTDDFSAATPSCAVVSGTWGLKAAKDALGDKLAAAKLPSYTVDGQTYQLGSFSGNKLIGVKPHTNGEDGAFCHALAQYLSGKECQLDRFDQFGWGPSNKAAKAEDRVKADPTLKALEEQNAFAKVQGQICGGWWDFAKLLGTESAKGAEAYQAALDDYTKAIQKYESMPVEAVTAWGVVGSIASLAGTTENLAYGQDKFTWKDDKNVEHTGWQDWNTDVAMTKEEKDGKEIWTSVVAIELKTTDSFKFRMGQAWGTEYAGTEDAHEVTAGTALSLVNAEMTNLNVAADGKYTIVLTIAKDGATIELIAA